MRRGHFVFLIILLSCFAVGGYAEDIASSTPHEVQPLSMGDAFVQMIFYLGLIVILLLFAGWFLKKIARTRMSHINTSSLIKIIERRSLAPKSHVYLLHVGKHCYLVGESPSGMHRIAEIPHEELEFEGTVHQEMPKKKMSFSEMMQQKLGRKPTQ